MTIKPTAKERLFWEAFQLLNEADSLSRRPQTSGGHTMKTLEDAAKRTLWSALPPGFLDADGIEELARYLVTAGYWLAPMEATPEMVETWKLDSIWGSSAEIVWSAMHNAYLNPEKAET